MESNLISFIKQLLSECLASSLEEFTSFLEQNDAYTAQIVDLAKHNPNVYFSENTHDGWYCIQQNNDTYRVFHQERGRAGLADLLIKGKHQAIAETLWNAGFTKLPKKEAAKS